MSMHCETVNVECCPILKQIPPHGQKEKVRSADSRYMLHHHESELIIQI